MFVAAVAAVVAVAVVVGVVVGVGVGNVSLISSTATVHTDL